MRRRLIAFLLLASFLLTAVGCAAGQTSVDTQPETASAAAEETTASIDTPSETEFATDPLAPETESETASEVESETETETESETEPPVDPESTELDKNKTYMILFIGNSYTYFANMPSRYFGEIMKSAGYKVRVISQTKGGWTLLKSANPDDELGSRIASTMRSKQLDFVVMQEQSMTPALNIGAFYSGVRKLDEKIRENGATPILYATWGRKQGSGDLTDYGLTSETMTWKLAAAYGTIGKTLDIPVAHVGLAFWDITQNQRNINLYDPDLSHPSEAGSYLAALTIFARITGIDPTTIDYDGGVGSEVDALLKEAARKAVFETTEIPEEYLAEAERRK